MPSVSGFLVGSGFTSRDKVFNGRGKMRKTAIAAALILLTLLVPRPSPAGSLAWPIGCIPGIDCVGERFTIGYPDVAGEDRAFDCGAPAYRGHTGTDVYVSSVDDGVPVTAALEGEVAAMADGRYDRCPDPNVPDCEPRPLDDLTRLWGFDPGNFVLLRHPEGGDAALTLYAHLRTGSVRVAVGQRVTRGEKLGEVGSSGNALTPHLHFSVWQGEGGQLRLVDPWTGPCGSNRGPSLWAFDPPYRADLTVDKSGRGEGVVIAPGERIDCGSRCAAPLLPGTTVTLTAAPSPGSAFVGWEGGCNGSDESCTLTVTGATAVTARFRDVTPPTVRSFALPPSSPSLTVPVLSFTADDNVRVSGYLVTESATRPPLNAPGWGATPPMSHTCALPGRATLYAWARDPSGNVSAPARADVFCGARFAGSAAMP
jgi:murein DD-endopeptidase MepM/ murein hydrolase activator NlpD